MAEDIIKAKVATLNNVKKSALKAGLRRAPLDVIVGIRRKEAAFFEDGQAAEVVMAYMLGLFKAAFRDRGFYIVVSGRRDEEGADFTFQRSNKAGYVDTFNVQLKFDKDDCRCYGNTVTVVKCGGSKKYTQLDRYGYAKKRSLPVCRGDRALFKMLTECGAFHEEEVLDFLDEHEHFVDVINACWELI